MKHCPQCEFIYEDDQSLCDMDGNILVYDPKQTILPQSTPVQVNDARKRSPLKAIAVPAVAGLILAALLCLAYASPSLLNSKSDSQDSKPGSLKQTEPETNPSPATKSSTMKSSDASSSLNETANEVVPEAMAPPADAGSAVKNTNPAATDSRLTISRRLPPLPRLQPLQRLPAAKVEAEKSTTKSRKAGKVNQNLIDETHWTSNQKPLASEQKKGSRVGSFLKKTGRFLKRPFKL
jgi:hypothetical protein